VTNLKLLNITSSNVTTLAINLKRRNHQKPNQLINVSYHPASLQLLVTVIAFISSGLSGRITCNQSKPNLLIQDPHKENE
jgi:hypothetical protein